MNLHRTDIYLRFLFGLLFGVVAVNSFAQDKDWRPITPQELQSKTPVVEPDADAEAIFWEVKIDSSWDLSMRHYVRVKIFTERGREDFSKFDIPYYKGKKISDVAARVIKPDGTINEIGKGDIFEREIVRANGLKIKAKSFAVPNIEPGVIVEYRYKEKVEDAGLVGQRLEFQRDIPIQKLSYYYKPFAGMPPIYRLFNFSDVKFVKDKDGYYLASRTKVPSFKAEPFMPPEDMVKPWMRVGFVNFFQFGAKWRIVEYLKKDSKDVKKTADEIVAGLSSEEAKVKKIYEFCQSQIENTNFDPSITDEMREKLPSNKSPKDVLKRKSGTAFDIDTLFGALTQSLGFETRIAFLGNRNKMFTDARRLDIEFLHPGGIAVKVDGSWKYFNPGIKYLPFGKLVWYEEAGASELVGETERTILQAPSSDHNYTQTKRTGRFVLGEDGSLDGSVVVELTGHSAVNYRIENYDESRSKLEQSLKDDVARQISTAEVSNISIENLHDPYKPLVSRYSVKIANYAQKTGKRLFLQPGFFEYGEKPIFSSAERNYDVFFRYPWSELDNIEIVFPKTFELDNADSPGKVSDPSEIGLSEIRISIDRTNSKLIYNRKFHFGKNGQVLFTPTVYKPLKDLFDAFHKADSHTIILKQK